MKTKININGKDVEIELTQEQVNQIKNQSIKYTDIKTLQDALNYNGETLEEFNHRTQFDDDQQKASKEIEVIAKAIRLGNELGDYWYYPWFNSTRSSVGFSCGDCGFGVTGSCVGSRLVYPSREIAEYVGKTHLQLYRDLMVID